MRGIEIQSKHHAELAAIVREHNNVRVFQEDVFCAEVSAESYGLKPNVLVLGNPPWVTNSELSALGSANLPRKTNIRNLPGIEAATGASNFDITEAIIYRLISQLQMLTPTIAILCKSQVARNVLLENNRRKLGISEMRIYKVNAMKWFGAGVDACLLRFKVGAEQQETMAVFRSLDDVDPHEHWFAQNSRLQKRGLNYDAASHVDGVSPVEWRQGVKHDATTVMELAIDGDTLLNGLGENVDAEPEWIFPLLKSSDLANGRTEPRRAVLITQKHPGEDTSTLRHVAPRLWQYLERHRAVMEARASSVYRGKSSFCIFGIGPYSFAPYKVAISGLYHTPRFAILGMFGSKPFMLDDTCYFVPCNSYERAVALYILLTSDDVAMFLRSVMFSGSKRPITKRLLQRIDLAAVANAHDQEYWSERIENARQSQAVPITLAANDVIIEMRRLEGPEQKLFTAAS